MQILWWLAPPVVTTIVAMLYVSWVGRRPADRPRTDAARERMGVAITRELPSTHVRSLNSSSSTGVVVRPPRRSA